MSNVEIGEDIEAEIKVFRHNGETEIVRTEPEVDEEAQLYILLKKAELLKRGYLFLMK
ncbi:MAG: hypothetical protein QIT36_gp100 [Methanophagales virus GBV301]|uniref:Uncharacterized protein n=1 Tax=Methanophagales virus GBV301 TaxID=2999280 RepID=A0A9E8V838_9CAUD|nr:MAG: hypothetical protein QIT36_gp100 [Methanophagales virus GBV301]WAE39524.1 MAG: hypothetical protein LDLAKGPJ_00100 [Methanophagales virus GBV301]